MKLSKTSWFFLGTGIFVILLLSFGAAYLQQSQQQDQLSEELSLAQLRLEKYSSRQQLSSQREELEAQLPKVQLQLKATRASLSQSVESIEASDTLFEIAEDSNVEIIMISSSTLNNEKLEGGTYSVLPLSVQIEGAITDLIDFIFKWSGEHRTGVMKSVGITIPKTNDAGELEKPSANLKLLIYSYQGQ